MTTVPPAGMAADYPPAGHFLRHLRIEADATRPGVCVGRLPVLPDLCGPDASVRLGAVAAALDVTAGTLAVQSVYPDWTATTHLSIQTSAGIASGSVTLTCRVARAGRTSVFIEARLTDDDGTAVGSATIGFQRLIRRDGNPDAAGAPEGRVTRLGSDTPEDRPALTDFIGVRPGGDGVEIDLSTRVANSFGTIQGGVVATLLEAAALGTAALDPTGETPVGRIADLEVHYLAAGKAGPFRAEAEAVRSSPGESVLRLTLRDVGADGRLLATGVAHLLS